MIAASAMQPALARLRPVVWVAASQVTLAASGYLVLGIAGRALDARGFVAVSSFLLVINTAGRGTFAAIELEMTRAVAQARAEGTGAQAALRAGARKATGFALGAVGVLILVSPLITRVFDVGALTVALLALAIVAMAASYFVRGPLAGARLYGRYSLTFAVEAAVGLVAAAILAARGVIDVAAWQAIFAVAPILAAATLGWTVSLRRTPAASSELDGVSGGTLRELAWSATFLVSSQGVWNLAPVLVTARLGPDVATAAGFTAAVILLRIPVMLFPVMQAFLLPRFVGFTRGGRQPELVRTMRRLAVILVVAGAGWIVVALLGTAELTSLLLGVRTDLEVALLLALAVSTLVGAGAQIVQTALVADRRQRWVAASWVTGLVVLLGSCLLPGPAEALGAIGQAVAASTVAVLLLAAWHRGVGRGRSR